MACIVAFKDGLSVSRAGYDRTNDSTSPGLRHNPPLPYNAVTFDRVNMMISCQLYIGARIGGYIAGHRGLSALLAI